LFVWAWLTGIQLIVFFIDQLVGCVTSWLTGRSPFGREKRTECAAWSMSVIDAASFGVWRLMQQHNAHFTPPARQDKTVLSVSCLAWRCELAIRGGSCTRARQAGEQKSLTKNVTINQHKNTT